MSTWNPITSFIGIAGVAGTEPETPPGSSHTPQYSDGHRPLGFIDVRSEVTTGSSSGNDPRSTASDHVSGTAETSHEPTTRRAHDLPLEVGADELVWPGATLEASADDRDAQAPSPIKETLEVERSDATVDLREQPEEKVPFFKREISFGRRKSRGASTPGEEVELEVVPEASAGDERQVDEAVLEPFEPVSVEEITVANDVLEQSLPDVEDTEEPVADLEVDGLPADDLPTEEPVITEQPVEPEPVTVVAAEATKEKRGSFLKRDVPFGRPKSDRPAPSARSGSRTVGLEIGASQIAAAVIVDNQGRRELAQLARTPIEPGVVVDGEVRDIEGLSSLLRSFFEEHKLPRRDIRVGLASNRIGVRTLDIVGVDDEERFANAVRFKAHEVLPMAMQESTLDYRVVGERLNEAGESIRRVLLAVAPRDQVSPYIDAAMGADLSLSAVDLEALGLLRTFVDPTPIGTAVDAATVVVNIGHESSILLVAGRGACEFTRGFEWGGATLQTAIEQELDVHPVEAATILRHIALEGSTGRPLETLDDDSRRRAVEAIRLRLAPFARELVSSLQYYQTQPDSLGIEEIVITGGTSALMGLAETLHQIIGVPVRVGDPLARVIVQKGLDVERYAMTLGSLSVAIGLAVDDLAMRSVNLLPQDARTAQGTKLSPRVLVPAAAILVPVAAVALLLVGARGSVSDKQSQLTALQADYAALPQPTVATVDPSLQGEEASRALGVANVLTQRLSWDVVLNDLSRVIPRNVWLSALDAQAPNPLGTPAVPAVPPVALAPGAPLPTPTGMTIQGYGYSHLDVARMLARLTTLPSLTNVQLQKSEKTKVGKKNVIQFTVLADLRANGGAR